MKKYAFLIMICAVLLTSLSAEDQFRFSILKEIDYPVYQNDQTIRFLGDNIILLDQKGLILVSSKTGKMVKRYENIGSLFGVLDDGRFIAKLQEDSYHIGLYNPEDESKLKLSIDEDIAIPLIAPFQKGQFFSAIDDEFNAYKAFKFDMDTNRMDYIGEYGLPLSISDDKLHILMEAPYSWDEKLFLWSPVDENVTAVLNRNNKINEFTSLFITNNLILGSENEQDWYLWDISGKRIAGFKFFTKRGGRSISKIVFSDDLKKALVAYRLPRGGGHTKTAIIDTTPFLDWLSEQGLLFKQTAAVVKGAPELREYPNLEASIIGSLDEGMEVTVVDRSGIKVQIGETEDWWYKIEISSGKTGWIYAPSLVLSSP